MKVPGNQQSENFQQSAQEQGVWYACQRCTNCCRWPGQVRLTDEDILRISEYLGMSQWDFIQRHTRLQASRKGLALLEQADGACEFLDGRDCRIQDAKPVQCAGFPNAWSFPGWRDVCEAVPIPRPLATGSSSRDTIGENAKS